MRVAVFTTFKLSLGQVESGESQGRSARVGEQTRRVYATPHVIPPRNISLLSLTITRLPPSFGTPWFSVSLLLHLP
jgi:hypothetical protein